MDSPQLALFALAIGAIIGAGTVLLVVWAYRVRALAAQETSTAVPAGVAEVLRGMDDPACVLNASGVVVAMSHAAERFGIRPGAVLDNADLRRLVRNARDDGDTAADTLRLAVGGSLDPRLVSARSSRIGAQLTLLIIRDVTERERLEQMRTDFVANTSHELKTPVASVSLLAEAIESAADDPHQVRVFAKRIAAEAGRLGQLTGRILSLARLQAAETLAQVRPISIDEVVAASVEAHLVQADSAGVTLTRGGERGAWVRGDAQVLVEAVGNLIANAIVYSPKGSSVGIGVKVVDDIVEIAVADQGIGIAEADAERIFERFYRADEARSRRTGGTGLGLSIVKHATQRHGGEVRLWSRPGRGSTFTIRLPRIEAPDTGKKKTKKSKKKRTDKSAAKAVAARNGENA
ncbi:two-component sensor histidine kinase [Microbacterium esteraromaticum]|uniref:Sensor-like histidine kinase SenX3 n=1 Tax=Microbacterium esteraromaticum TaxID=57043 RepID=A0A939DWT9_9MICO|nr:ATP-binding protein [Microbacterium esteraromaticum]MBN8206785.1 two-component sensor histidine kinase [Microbacterium esteraromaticum]MBN8416940.1 two-component sensor histidine kinase [Microbacterium esteraromaticum]MBN8425567.1 two-component sensor histidine kinase [Microbacterium esteraromaticum]